MESFLGDGPFILINSDIISDIDNFLKLRDDKHNKSKILHLIYHQKKLWDYFGLAL